MALSTPVEVLLSQPLALVTELVSSPAGGSTSVEVFSNLSLYAPTPARANLPPPVAVRPTRAVVPLWSPDCTMPVITVLPDDLVPFTGIAVTWTDPVCRHISQWRDFAATFSTFLMQGYLTDPSYLRNELKLKASQSSAAPSQAAAKAALPAPDNMTTEESRMCRDDLDLYATTLRTWFFTLCAAEEQKRVLAILYSALSPSLHHLIKMCSTAYEAWKALCTAELALLSPAAFPDQEAFVDTFSVFPSRTRRRSRGMSLALGCGMRFATIQVAVESGNLALVQFLLGNRLEAKLKDAMCQAAASSDLQILRWLVTQPKAPDYMHKVLEAACTNLSDDVVAYLQREHGLQPTLAESSRVKRRRKRENDE
ncbi:hypothetical protein SDRG_08032 [Saprolegnia diclina VS20]|uniref:Uncharacterized protein n=1 Tax=Saprolegnia diclina (strain VS20) TaxID=1156394 RepID=T0QKE4_SAPDV|nr:hypothetical protein SDRG_08032 [Saprolegnia diclina VS20]EQC34260.1 hypothetical protein SDRG_08032 [Saprolegnia diclina VS20]|eukprot:XP_008612122.1 hypothetical protein SDRG_08032 [Saprolegnia diclina VS20]